VALGTSTAGLPAGRHFYGSGAAFGRVFLGMAACRRSSDPDRPRAAEASGRPGGESREVGS
jgi:hypothetical protein